MLTTYIEIVIGALALGVFLRVLMSYRVAQAQQLRRGRKRDVERLIAEFQGLFRQIDQEKRQHP